uniref:Uncharacterized protein n=1 Tax=Chromera velia CCMP2878 TaxID=1169474 RepID=A0A0G4IFN4_9ALVE|eukprot:Cvel_14072.t1-p1 / transcript=Cvel_14072.t1 / gene=Cvel_14072 / organism=Chromera_velia_CCMP2878 / gene_product=hypothetical protein / transcript_product=hypothetical protein / location=Cvel_scaffold988:19170-19688(-) / protein_length=173 / sequence_SO=supercontig / SO=protein_coding / is_pseudo=false
MKCHTDKIPEKAFIIRKSDYDYWSWWKTRGEYFEHAKDDFHKPELKLWKDAILTCKSVDRVNYTGKYCPIYGYSTTSFTDFKKNGCLDVNWLDNYQQKKGGIFSGHKCTMSWNVVQNELTDFEECMANEGNYCSTDLSLLAESKEEKKKKFRAFGRRMKLEIELLEDEEQLFG